MTGVGIALLVPAALIVLYLAVCAVLLCRTLLRVRTKEIEPESVGRLRGYGDFVRSGVRWLLDREPEEVEIASFDGTRLRGLFLPAENAKCTAILMHGYRSDCFWDFAGIYALLHENGCNLLVPWQRAHGKSGGRMICMGVKEKRDCALWARYIEERLGRELPAVLQGVSMGASTVLMAAGEKLPENVRGIVADCGFTSPWDEFAYLLRSRAGLPAHPLLDGVSLLCRIFAGWGFRDCSTEETLRESRLPILLLHGEADHFVPPEFSERSFAASAAEDKTLLTVPDAGHAMCYPVDAARCAQAVLAFYARVTAREEKA